MAKPPVRKGGRPPRRPPERGGAADPSSGEAWPTGGTTGRTLVLFARDAVAAGTRALERMEGMKVASTADFAGGPPEPDDLGGAGALLFPDLGVAVVDRPCGQIRDLARTEASGILAVEAERVVHAIAGPGWTGPGRPAVPPGVPLDYLRGYRDAVNHLYDMLTGEAARLGSAAEDFQETEQTWGLQATRVPESRFSGRGIRVAVLDTGLDLGHPDFAGRAITSRSFVTAEEVQDGNGHGTHCIGTACGPLLPATPPRYGIATEAEIFAGKVLSNQGSGGDAGILGGIQWAITNGCAIVSMSLGAPVQVGQPFSQIFEQVASRALAAGTLIIAAAGNESERPQTIAPVGHPANCPSIMAVAAVDRRLGVAPFSCGGLNPNGGQVDIAAPGVDILSSWPRPTLRNTISGTSMATPHVAGIAALWAQSDAAFRGRALMSILTQSARRLNVPARDIGSGLVQAP